MQITTITVNQLITMFFFMGIGYFFSKKKIFEQDAGATLSKLLVNVFLPAMVLRSFSSGFTVSVVRDKLLIILFSCAVLAITTVLAVVLSRFFSKNPDTRGIYIYSFAIPNLGYMGYPLVQAIFPDSFLDTQVYCFSYSIFIYTVGIYLLTTNKKISFKSLLSPSLVAVFAGAVLGLMNFKMPALVDRILLSADNCVAPAAMILTGTVFARINLKSVFSDWRSYVSSLIRLLIIPILALFIFRALGLPNTWIIPSVVILAMPFGANSVVFPEAYGGDAISGAKVCFMSTILSLLTIPVVFALL